MLLDTPICDFGWKAPDFTLKDPSGTEHRMSDYLGPKGLLITFICNHCPYVQAIADRLATDTALLASEGIKTLAVMSNDYRRVPSDSPPEMMKFAQQHGFGFPYLIDEDQSVAQTYGAVCTPDFFGLNGQGELHYRGRLDDLRMGGGSGGSSDRTAELINAMRLIAETGKGPNDQTPSMGCSIKWT